MVSPLNRNLIKQPVLPRGSLTTEMAKTGIKPHFRGPAPISITAQQQLAGQPAPVIQEPQPTVTSAPATNMPQSGLGGALNTLSGTYDQAMQNLQQGQMGAYSTLQGTRQDILNQQELGTNALAEGIKKAMGMIRGGQSAINRATSQGRDDITSGRDLALEQLAGSFDQARADMSGFDAGGREAVQLQAALSGSMGPEAQAQAMQGIMDSPEFDFIREQGRRELLANAAATGGTGGGEIKRDLTRFGQGLAAQRFDTAYNRIGGVADRGINVANILAGLSAQRGTTEANAAQTAAQQLSALQAQKAAAQAQLSGRGADIAGRSGEIAAQLAGQYGSQLGNIGSRASDILMSGGQIGANIATGIGGQAANAQMQAGTELARQLAGQTGGISDLINQQGTQLAGQVDQSTANIANILSGAGQAEAGDLIRTAELLQALASQNAASGSAAIGQGGSVAANAALAQGQNVNDLLGNLTSAYAIYKGGLA